MRKAVVLVLFTAAVAAGVWYLVTQLPQEEGARISSASPPGAAQFAAPTPPLPDTASPTRAPDTLPPLGPVCGGRCGVERWAVKTLSDVDRARVDLTPVDATIEDLAALPRGQAAPGHERMAPVELTTYRVRGYLAAAFNEDDHDRHLVLYGLRNQRVSIIAEIPDPGCAGACRSGLSEAFAQARAALEERLAHANLRDEPLLVEVTGVGFFDFRHGQIGLAPNAFELHPVLAITFPQ